MSFQAILREIIEGCGAAGAALMQSDGIPIEEASSARSGLPLEGDVATAGVEFGRILAEIRKASDAVGGGAVRDTTISLGRVTLLFRPIDEDTFLIVSLDPDGNLGKARYLMRRHLLALRQEL